MRILILALLLCPMLQAQDLRLERHESIAQFLYRPYWAEGDTKAWRIVKIADTALLALDIHSTYRALDKGYVEGSPLWGRFEYDWKNNLAYCGMYYLKSQLAEWLYRKGGDWKAVAWVIRLASIGSGTRAVAWNYSRP
jgi:hypothetical protein